MFKSLAAPAESPVTDRDPPDHPPTPVPWRRGVAGLALLTGTGCLLGALTTAGIVAAVLLDALAGGAGDGGGCMGALVLPGLLLVGSAGLGSVGAALATAGGVRLWQLSADGGAG